MDDVALRRSDTGPFVLRMAQLTPLELVTYRPEQVAFYDAELSATGCCSAHAGEDELWGNSQ